MLSCTAISIPKFWQRKIGVPEQKKSLAKILILRLQYTTACNRTQQVILSFFGVITCICYAIVYCNLKNKILARKSWGT